MGRGEHVPLSTPLILRPCINFSNLLQPHARDLQSPDVRVLIIFRLSRDSAASLLSSSSHPTPSLNSIPTSNPQLLPTTPPQVCCSCPSSGSSSQAERVSPSFSSSPVSLIPLISSARSVHEITMSPYHDLRKVLFEESGGWCYPPPRRRPSAGSYVNWARISWPREGMLPGFGIPPQA